MLFNDTDHAALPPTLEEPKLDGPEANPDWISWAGEFEGDILLTEEQRLLLNGSSSERYERGWDLPKLWPSPQRIPYVIDSKYTTAEKFKIKQAMVTFKKRSCLRFVKKTNETNYINIKKSWSSCASYVGYVGNGAQSIWLATRCLAQRVIIHELMHAVGFYHEQSRIDRDRYVVILWNNIYRTAYYNFEKTRLPQRFPYDERSVMHYTKFAFSKNGLPTIKSRRGIRLGNEKGFTGLDIMKLNDLYCLI